MASGGARANSGPAKDPNSRSSERAGYKLRKLPAEGRKGRTPAFPLPKIVRYGTTVSDGKAIKVADGSISNAFRKRELEIWREYWKTPQAAAWETEPYRYRAIAMVCRLESIIETEPEANAALIAQLHRYREDVGLTQAGLKLNGWTIAANEVAAQRERRATKPAPAKAAPVRRLRGVK